MYEIGDYIVKGLNGVCRVADIMHLSGESDDKLYYLLIPVNDQGGKIYAPTDRTNESTRKAMTREEAEDFLEKISDVTMDYNTNEKERTKEYKQIVSAGDPKQLVGIMKMVYIQNKERSSQGKKSAAVDDKYCKIAEHLLYTELGLALDKNEREIGGIMRCAIRK